MKLGENEELLEIDGRNEREIRLKKRIVMRRMYGDRIGDNN